MEDIYCFGGNPLDRASERRRDREWIAKLLGDPESRILPLRDLKPTGAHGHAHPALRVPGGTGSIVHAKDTSGTRPGRPMIPSPTANFDGISANGSAPPDTQGAAGSTQYFEMANRQAFITNVSNDVSARRMSTPPAIKPRICSV